jgi:hypothetical protein
MNATTQRPLTAPRRLARATISLAAIAAVALGATSLPTSAATPIAKAHAANIGAGATRVLVLVDRGVNAKTDRYSRDATNNAAIIVALIDRVNALPKAPPPGEMCPMDVGAKLTLSFYRHAAKPYAIVSADPGGCGPVSIRDYHANDSLASTATVGGGGAFSNYVAAQLHITTLEVF